MRAALFLFVFLSIPGCVVAPTDNGNVSSRLDGIPFDGYAAEPNATLQIRAWSYARAAWEPLQEFRATDSAIGTDHLLYAYATVDAVLAGARYWVPPGASCETGGMARFQVRERSGTNWIPLATFDAGGLACLSDQLAGGAEPYDAGVACRTGDRVVLFAPGACVTVPATDPTPPRVVLRATDDDRAWELKDGDLGSCCSIAVPRGHALHLTADAFDPQGPRAVHITYKLDVTCGNPSSGAYVRHVTLHAHEAQPAWPGSVVDGSLGTDATIDATSLASQCSDSRFPAHDAQIAVTASGWSWSYTSTTTAQLAFAMTL